MFRHARRHSIRFIVLVDPDGFGSVLIYGTIDGEPDVLVHNVIIRPEHLVGAATESGRYPLFACPCVAPDCPRFDTVRVEADDRAVTWAWDRGGTEEKVVFGRRRLEAACRRTIGVYERAWNSLPVMDLEEWA